MIRGPGGTITIDAGGVTIEGIAIKLKGPMTQSSGAGNALSISGNPVTGEPICVSCLLKAIAEGRSVIRMQG